MPRRVSKKPIRESLADRLRKRLAARLLDGVDSDTAQPDPVTFPGATANFGKPKGWDDSRDGPCGTLPLQQVTHWQGMTLQQPVYQSCWALTRKQRWIAFLTGRVWLCCVGLQPPVSLAVKRLYPAKK